MKFKVHIKYQYCDFSQNGTQQSRPKDPKINFPTNNNTSQEGKKKVLLSRWD